MSIDFHTHTFPEKIAEKALNNLSNTSRTIPHTDGTASGRIKSMKNAGLAPAKKAVGLEITELH